MTPDAPAPDEHSFEALLASVMDRAYSLASHLTHDRDDAADLVQTAALQAFRAFHQYQPGTNFRAWFLRILTNCFLAQYRMTKRRPRPTAIEDVEPLVLYDRAAELGLLTQSPDPAARVLENLGVADIQAAIHALPDDFRLTCALYFVEQLSYQEIAEVTEVALGTVRSRLHRGRRLLQRELWTRARAHGIVGGQEPGESRP